MLVGQCEGRPFVLILVARGFHSRRLRPTGARCRRRGGQHLARSCLLGSALHATPLPRHQNNVLLSTPPSMQAKQPRSRSIVCSTSPPSRTRTQRLLGTSPYQTAPSASRQMPSGAPLPSSAQTRWLERLPSAAMSNAVSLLL